MELNALYAALMGLSAHRELAGETGEPEVRVMEHAERLLFFLKHGNGEHAMRFYIQLFQFGNRFCPSPSVHAAPKQQKITAA